MKTLRDFIENFDIVENAMEQRNLVRWNGRNLRTRENLAEHTHLVVACSMKLVDYIKKNGEFEIYQKIEGIPMYRDDQYLYIKQNGEEVKYKLNEIKNLSILKM